MIPFLQAAGWRLNGRSCSGKLGCNTAWHLPAPAAPPSACPAPDAHPCNKQASSRAALLSRRPATAGIHACACPSVHCSCLHAWLLQPALPGTQQQTSCKPRQPLPLCVQQGGPLQAQRGARGGEVNVALNRHLRRKRKNSSRCREDGLVSCKGQQMARSHCPRAARSKGPCLV